MLRLVLSLAVLLLVAAPVRADVFAIVPPFFKGTDGLQVSERIVAIIHDDLKRQSERALAPEEVVAFVPADQRKACGSEQCAERYRAAAKATAAIVVRIYRGKVGDGPATSFQLEIQPEPGIEFTESGLLDDAHPLEDEVVRALREAQRRYRRGPGPWLQITGGPDGATILIDDVKVGTLLPDSPRVLAVSAGTHQLRIEARGFEGVTKLVNLPNVTDTQSVDIRLEPENLVKPGSGIDGTEPASETAPKRAWANVGWVVAGAGALGVGVALLVGGVGSAVRDQDCAGRDSDSGACTKRYTFDGGAKARLAVGSLLTAAGIFGVAWGSWKLRVSVEPSIHSAELVLRGNM